MLKVTHSKITSPIEKIELVQPKGALDLTIAKNSDGKRIRISNVDGNVVSVDTTKLAYFIDALTQVNKSGAKSAKRA